MIHEGKSKMSKSRHGIKFKMDTGSKSQIVRRGSGARVERLPGMLLINVLLTRKRRAFSSLLLRSQLLP